MYVLHDNIVHHTSNRPPECKNFHPKYILNGLISSNPMGNSRTKLVLTGTYDQ